MREKAHNITQLQKINREKQCKSLTYGVSKASFSTILNTIKVLIQKLQELQAFESLITKIVTAFLNNHQDQTKATLFRFRFKDHLKGTYLDILLLMREFTDFSIYNYITVTANADVFSQEQKETLKQLFISRNNIVLSILITATHYHFSELNKEVSFGEDNQIFSDLSFLNPTIEELRNLIIEDNEIVTIEYDVEFLFFALLGFKEISNMIKQKHFKYFKNFLEECDLLSSISFDSFLCVTLEKKEFKEFSNEEIILFRKILNNSAKRRLYHGLYFLLKNVEYSFLLSEGRIWKSIGIKLKHDQAYNLWLLYREYLDEIRVADLKETLAFEYKKKLIILQAEIKYYENTSKKGSDIPESMKKSYYMESKLNKEIQMYHVTCLKELLVIYFQNDLKELVQFFFDEFKSSKKDTVIPIEIYEICLDYDEDISLDIMDRSLTAFNAKENYMQISLLKKYYRLARCLLRYPACRNYLNCPPPDSDEYLVWITKLEMKKRKQMIDKIKYTKDIINEQTKILEFIKSYMKNDESKEGDNKESEEVVYREKATSKAGSFLLKTHKKNNEIENEDDSHFSGDSKILCLNPVKRPSKLETQIPNKKEIELPDTKNDSNPSNTISNLLDLTKTPDKGRGYSLPKISSDQLMRKISNPLGAFSQFFKQNIFQQNLSNKNANNIRKNPLKMLVKTVDIKSRTKALIPNVSVPPNSRPLISQELIPSKFRIKPGSSFNIHGEIDNYTPKDRKSILNRIESTINKSEMTSNSMSTMLKEPTQDIISLDKIKKGLLNINILLVLVEQLRIGEYACDCLCLLSSMKEKRLSSFYLNKIFSYLLYYTINEEAISKCPEPLLFIALAGEYLSKIGEQNHKSMYKAKTVIEEILSFGQKLQSSMKDEDMLNYYLKEQYDNLGRNALQIIAENQFFSLLDDFEIGTIVNKIWSGEERSSDLFKFLRMTRILQTNIYYEEFSSSISNMQSNGTAYSFQYSQFTQNCPGRYFLDSALIGLMAIYYEYVIYRWTLIKKSDYNDFRTLEYIGNCLIYSSILNFLLIVLFLNLTKRQSRVSIFDILLASLMGLLLLLNFIGLPSMIFDPAVEEQSHLLLASILFSFVIIFAWTKVSSILMTTYSYGPFLRIMISVFWEVVRFMIIVICITFLFAQVFTLFFQNSNTDFVFFFDGFISLFNTAFGQINFDAVTSLDLFGYICLMLYSTLSNVMLFNLIVAIINNLFNGLQSQADSESRAVLIITHERIKWDENYGLLILLPAPFNLFSLPFVIVLLCSSKESTAYFNTLFSKICYIIIALAYFVLLFIIGVLAYPFALAKAVVHSIYDLIQLSDRLNRFGLFLALFMLPIKLWLYFFQDLYRFWCIVYQPNLLNEEAKAPNDFSKEYVVALRKVLIDLRFKEQKKTITINELYKEMSVSKNKQWYKKTLVTKKLLNGSISDNTSSNSSFINHIQSSNPNLISLENNESEKELTEMIREGTKMKFRLLIDKIVDPEGIIDIERTLVILPSRIKYSKEYFRNLKYLNIRVLLRGARKNAFKNDNNNWRYSFRKLQLLIYKVLIKFRMMYHFVPSSTFKEAVREINAMEQFQKNNLAFLIYEDRDNASEYDDEGEFLSTLDFSNEKHSKIALSNIKSVSDSDSKENLFTK